MRPMKDQKGEVDKQLEAAYSDGSALGRMLAGVSLIVALVALFIYRAATTDPLWEEESSSATPLPSENQHAPSSSSES